VNIALLNRPTLALEQCELTFIGREPIQFETAIRQHAAYAEAIQRAGVQVKIFEANQTSPDAVFVEDVAVILDEVAIMTSMGSPSRRNEIPGMAEIIMGFRKVRHISLPATIEGGDVLKVGKTLYVGETSRTNGAGITALGDIVRPYGYCVVPVKVHGCLHLKTCITALNDDLFIRNPAWLDSSPFEDFTLIDVAENEPWGANVLRIGDNLLVNAALPHSADLIESLGFKTERVDISEFSKAEAGLTCMSLIFKKDV